MNAYVLFLVSLPAALISFPLEVRRKKASPRDLPYTWGFYQGMTGVLLGGYCVIGAVVLSLSAGQGSTSGASFLLMLGSIWGVAGYFVIKRRKWAWVVHTIASLNPVWWIANSIYGHNRWHEFDRDSATPLNAYGLPLGQTPAVRKEA
jgi:hypothetical protein